MYGIKHRRKNSTGNKYKNRKLTIWLIKAAEEMPTDSSQHLSRVGGLAEYLSNRGHHVVWWKSTFHHGSKSYLYDRHTEIKPNKNWKVVCLHSKIPYKKNVSITRIIHYRLLANEFARHSRSFKTPDLIFCAWPTAVFAKAAIDYGKKHRIPVVIDIRDLWPDIFVRAFPEKIKPITEIALVPMKKKAARIMRQAYSITGVTEDAVRWGCRYAGRFPEERDRPFFIGCKKADNAEKLRSSLPEGWKKKGLDGTTWNICFLGSLRNSGLDLKTVILAVKELQKKYPDIRLAIAGEGDSRKELETLSKGTSAVIFLGWQNETGMNTLMSISKCGAYCIENTEDFVNTFSNKAVQYLSLGVPILNSLRGYAKTLISEKNVGLTYREKDVQDCMEKIETLYLDEVMRNDMSKKALDLFAERFDSEVVNQKIENYFYKVIKDWKKRGRGK